ncbi:MAG: hypothetical protein R3E34_01855 [Rhodocyclaceae bacterium]
MQLRQHGRGPKFKRFRDTGRQTDTSSAEALGAIFEEVWFFNSRLEIERGDVTFKPRFYYNTWYPTAPSPASSTRPPSGSPLTSAPTRK